MLVTPIWRKRFQKYLKRLAFLLTETTLRIAIGSVKHQKITIKFTGQNDRQNTINKLQKTVEKVGNETN